MKPPFPAGNPPLVYCVLNRIVLQAEHREDIPESAPPDAILDELRSNRLVAEDQVLRAGLYGLIEARTEEQRRRVVTLRGTEPRIFSLITLDFPEDNQMRLIRRVRDLNVALRQNPDQGSRLRLTLATPEWLSSGAPIHLGGGGPGGYPRPFIPTDPATGRSRGRRWRVEAPTRGGVATSGGEGVSVIILDTAPPPHQMARAYAAWADCNELVDRLLAPASPLSISYASYADLLDLEPYGLHRHRYEMTDHGLFVAGIIHSLAPEARLELIEVLNPYGVGSVRMIAAGLREAGRRAAEKGRGPVVVNCSLVIYLPRPADFEQLKPKELRLLGVTTKEEFEQLCLELEADVNMQLGGACTALREAEVLIVAAAGNDAAEGARPPARVPAAFDAVVGVGALDQSNIPAPYSNISDAPTGPMIASFGGQVEPGPSSPTPAGPPARETAEGTGMLGIYIGAFPTRGRRSTANANGWAWWAGTSFAAPVISGLLARLRSASGGGFSAAGAASEVEAKTVGPTDVPNELVLPATQV